MTILLICNCQRHIIFATFPQLKSKITFLLSLKANDWYCCFIGTKNDVTLEYEQLCVVLHPPLNLNPEQSFTSASWHAEVLLHLANLSIYMLVAVAFLVHCWPLAHSVSVLYIFDIFIICRISTTFDHFGFQIFLKPTMHNRKAW